MFSPRNIRLATDEERMFYDTQLYPLQDQICQVVSGPGLYLSGGTALSRGYFMHRYSDDLDFFYSGHLYPKENFNVEVQECLERISSRFNLEILVSGDYFRRAMVKDNGVTLKLEFVYDPHTHIGEIAYWNGCRIDSLENIGTNKITAVQDRKTARDFVDLYFLLNELDFDKLLLNSKQKVVPLDYENMLLAFSDRYLEGTALMITPLEIEKMNRFGSELVGKLLTHARTVQ